MITDWVSTLAGGELSLTLDLPFAPHTPIEPTVGGSRTAAAGVPASYVVRRDYVVTVPFRVWEEEWVAFCALLAWGQQSEILTWTPDIHATSPESFEVWLEFPKAGEDIAPVRDGEMPAFYRIDVQFRKVDGTPWNLRYFKEVGIG